VHAGEGPECPGFEEAEEVGFEVGRAVDAGPMLRSSTIFIFSVVWPTALDSTGSPTRVLTRPMSGYWRRKFKT
jgi:hypothetical protein